MAIQYVSITNALFKVKESLDAGNNTTVFSLEGFYPKVVFQKKKKRLFIDGKKVEGRVFSRKPSRWYYTNTN